MKVELFPFQKKAVEKLRIEVANSLGSYRSTHTPQIVSYTAPTGAGKTIIMAALMESIYTGDEQFPEHPEAIFVWLSDSPQLNEQSKEKIDTKADRIKLNQCVIINDDSFDRELLEDGHIYFVNTQKLSKTSNLTKHSDGRQYTIWETLSNTVAEKSDRLYFIIDEAHRGAQKSSDLAKATTIMQKFLKGSLQDNLPPMPVVIGMTATSERFIRLAQGIQSTTHYVATSAAEVRASGLLKDRIVISYPDNAGKDMAVLQAAADEWKDKWQHWSQYCYEQHYAYVNPVFVIQVQNGSGTRLSFTDLDECLRTIEERTGDRFVQGEVVHAFGETTSTITVNGLNVPYVEPSRIADDRRIKIVFFKETLSTGWDCPRAETMMSFRRANDHTYIAQLLGRMVRTPMQMHINVDDTLNDVHLFLPGFNSITVKDVVDALQSAEGGSIPADIETEEIGNGEYDILTLHPTYTPTRRGGKRERPEAPGQMSLFDDYSQETQKGEAPDTVTEVASPITQQTQPATKSTPTTPPVEETHVEHPDQTPVTKQIEDTENTEERKDDFDREAVVKAINDAGLLSYNVRSVRINDYVKSMYALARLLTQTRIDIHARSRIIEDIILMIRSYVDSLKRTGEYKTLSDQVMQFKLKTQVFDVFGYTVDNYQEHDLYSTTDADIDRQYRAAEIALGNEGVSNAYLNKYSVDEDLLSLKIDVILYAASVEQMDSLKAYAQVKFHELNDDNRRKTTSLPEKFKKRYDDIVSDGDVVSKHNFRVPETIRMRHDEDGKKYKSHLFVDNSGTATIKLNGWEEKVIEEEENQNDFVCWVRNPSRGTWALCIPYELNGEMKPAYPDFLIVRDIDGEYVVDILEPHDPSRVDNLGKAKGFAEYARQNPGVGRIQLIRMRNDSLGNYRPFRLDMSKSLVRDKVSRCASMAEIDNVFDEEGFFM